MMFTFQLKEVVRIIASGECGEIIGRAEYTYGNPQYQLRYKRTDGCAVEQWWTSDALELAEVDNLL